MILQPTDNASPDAGRVITDPGQPTDGQPTRRGRTFLWVFSILMILTAGSAFVFKLIEFYHTATTTGSQALASFLIPVLNYLIVAVGFLCLFLWAYFSGQFRDLEAPKYRMLQMQQQFDRDETADSTA